MAAFNLKQEFLESIRTFFKRPYISGVFITYALFLVIAQYLNYNIPDFIGYFLIVVLDIYLVAMVVTHYRLHTALNILQKRLLYYFLLFILLNLIGAPLMLAALLFMYKLPSIFITILLALLALLYFYVIFIRLYFLAPIIILSKENNPWTVVKRSWNRGKKYQDFLIRVGTLGIIFYLLSIAAPLFVQDRLLSTALFVFFSGISLPIIKILFVKAGMHVLKR